MNKVLDERVNEVKAYNTPLVTICVVSYNSSRFVTETLDSIKDQSYENLELIISDDGSTDGTELIEQEWLIKNRSRFVSSKLITVENNTGVTANCNRGLEASTGEWWKIIAADDILTKDCIEQFIKYIHKNTRAEFIFGNQISFSGDFATAKLNKERLKFSASFFSDTISASKQYRIITRLAQVGCAPASFAKTELLKRVGGFNPRFPMNEDTPLYIHLTKNGVKLWHMDEYVVFRRRHEMSIMRQKDEDALFGKASVRYIEGEWAKYIQENSNWFWRCMSKYSNWLSMNVIKTGNTKNSLKCRVCYWCSKWLSPYKWYLIWALAKERIMISCRK